MWVGIARVKNESDIIEAFVRHSLWHLDKLVLIDHASTDRTPAILASLVAEGLPIEVQQSSVFEPQGEALTRLMRGTFSQDGAEWVVPLDADEFIEVGDGSRLRDGVRDSDNGESLELFWQNFLYVPASTDDLECFSRMPWRSFARSELPKVAIPRVLGTDPEVVVYEGSHFIARDGVIVRGRAAEDLTLCHFPIRSLEQYRLKVIVGTLRLIISPSADGREWGWHYRRPYDLILRDRLDELESLMREESINYSARQAAEAPILKPFARLGGPLRYTTAEDKPSTVASLALFAETMARELQEFRKPRPRGSRLQEFARRLIGSDASRPPEYVDTSRR